MASFVAVTFLSAFTLYLGTYIADRVENCKCTACGLPQQEPIRRRAKS
ncbi:MAG: hypothetical protein ACXVZZ_01115 [Terriglobales bacterium]